MNGLCLLDRRSRGSNHLSSGRRTTLSTTRAAAAPAGEKEEFPIRLNTFRSNLSLLLNPAVTTWRSSATRGDFFGSVPLVNGGSECYERHDVEQLRHHKQLLPRDAKKGAEGQTRGGGRPTATCAAAIWFFFFLLKVKDATRRSYFFFFFFLQMPFPKYSAAT